MTKTEVERLAALETIIGTIQSDLAEVKTDVKVLLASRAFSQGAGSVFLRGIPWMLSVVAIIVAVAAR